MSSEVDEVFDLARQLATAAASLLRRQLAAGARGIVTKSTATDLSTEADRASEHLIVAGILDRRPEDSILGEEGTAVRGRSGVSWTVDPLDGTTNFVYGHPGFSVSIAAAFEDGTRIGVVADPLNQDVFAACSGRGATRNGLPIRCSEETRLDHALVATGFGYDVERRRHQAEVLTRVLPAVRDIRRMGGAAADLCSAACGRVDVYYEWGLSAWDYAAGVVIAAEAGAKVAGLNGAVAGTELVLACPEALFESFAELLDAAGAGLPRQGASPNQDSG